MAVLSMLLGATVLVFCAVIFTQRLVRGSDPRRRARRGGGSRQWINGDGDTGLKIREKGLGDLDVSVKGVETASNIIGGISIREDDTGSLRSAIEGATSLGNGGAGIDFDENSTGDLTARLVNATTLSNVGLDLRADEGGAGTGLLSISSVTYGKSGGNVMPTIIK